MSLRSLITKYGSPYNVTRLAAGAVVKGQFTPGAPTVIPIVAYIEPKTGGQLEDLAEGQRKNEIRTLFTTTEVRGGANPDTIVVDGDSWTFTNVERWDGLSGSPHYRCEIARTTNP